MSEPKENLPPESESDKRAREQRMKEYQEYAHEAANRPVIKFGSKKDHEAQQQVMQETGPYLTLGIQMGVSIVVFFGAGYWLDHRFHSSPLWTAVLTGIGAVLSLSYFIMTVLRLSKKTETKRP